MRQLGCYVKFARFGIDIVTHIRIVERMGLVVVESELELEAGCMNYLYSEAGRSEKMCRFVRLKIILAQFS